MLRWGAAVLAARWHLLLAFASGLWLLRGANRRYVPGQSNGHIIGDIGHSNAVASHCARGCGLRRCWSLEIAAPPSTSSLWETPASRWPSYRGRRVCVAGDELQCLAYCIVGRKIYCKSFLTDSEPLNEIYENYGGCVTRKLTT